MQDELYKYLLEKKIGKTIENLPLPSEKEMKKVYRTYPILNTSHIFIELPNNPTKSDIKSTYQRAIKIYRTVLTKKKSFTDYAKLYSDDTFTKNTGGNLGFRNHLSLMPQYYAAAKRLKKNRVSKPVRTTLGFHLIKNLGKLKYEDADKQQLRKAAFNEKRKPVFDRYFSKLKKKYSVKINKSLLK